jgi:GGDEF domain-containing protein
MKNVSVNRWQLEPVQKLYLILLVFAASLLAATLFIVQNNSTRTIAAFVFLLFFGAGITLALGLARGVLIALLVMTLWIITKRLLGVWEQVTLWNNLTELIMAGLTFLWGGVYHNQLQAFSNAYRSYQNQLRRLDLEDKAVGLLKPSVGLLRLEEEEERSLRYRRPFALVLVRVGPTQGVTWEPSERSELMRAIAADIKDTTRATDIPFLAAEDRIAIILPETETSGASKVVNNIFTRMTKTRFVTRAADSLFVQTRAQLRFGFAAFLGASDTKISMLAAAEQSLARSLEINAADLFQNIFMEWVTVGERPVSSPLFDKVAH